MQINFEKAHKLISKLEEKLQATTTHTNQARVVLDEWRQKGEAGLKRKTAEALKLVRKKADGFAEALTHLEQSFAKSLDRLSDTLEKPAASEKPRQPTKKSARKIAVARKVAGRSPRAN